MKSLLASLLSLAVLGGCTSRGWLENTAHPPAEDESYFVIGVTPSNHRVSVFPGEIENGVFHQSRIYSAALYGAAKDGFVVGKSPAGRVLAITKVRVVEDENAVLRGRNFVPCESAQTFVFSVPKGKVIYIGSVDYAFQNDKLRVRYRDDLAEATKYIDANYPELKGLTEYQAPQLLRTDTSCSPGTMYIPIYIRSK
ncbi:hypothetical protein HBH1_01214 [Herbaspirillum sp. BH-1]|uniref:Lipoprotein n=1 Tax=Herbaspirillum frisingense TaxID=92645 RepID=A0ABU1PA96_9BURK|nr:MULTISPECIES: hypothetical protein [Herbaspirillum]MDR6582851.1 hypothetical protein [Herbaspirillum frisingense]PLY60566.1 hypothetical protein HBH1_01214 [Herbaspirillum sp. BH-1]